MTVEMANMVYVYGFTVGNSTEARRIYIERLPNHPTPNPLMFRNVRYKVSENQVCSSMIL
ncbi:hypothetical protein ABEB36_015105 [Hypothenemus hampei]|uniref:DUF4817 domain-containing protein n=1 Tax=Hypothenemus hampei TaxID=57062 RepID=A0ABD1E2H6_HYPHA